MKLLAKVKHLKRLYNFNTILVIIVLLLIVKYELLTNKTNVLKSSGVPSYYSDNDTDIQLRKLKEAYEKNYNRAEWPDVLKFEWEIKEKAEKNERIIAIYLMQLELLNSENLHLGVIGYYLRPNFLSSTHDEIFDSLEDEFVLTLANEFDYTIAAAELYRDAFPKRWMYKNVIKSICLRGIRDKLHDVVKEVAVEVALSDESFPHHASNAEGLLQSAIARANPYKLIDRIIQEISEGKIEDIYHIKELVEKIIKNKLVNNNTKK